MDNDAAFDFIRRHGKRGQARLEQLAQLHHIVKAWQSDVGRVVLIQDIKRFEQLRERHIKELDKMPIRDIVELGLLQERIDWLADCFRQYEEGTLEVLKDDSLKGES